MASAFAERMILPVYELTMPYGVFHISIIIGPAYLLDLLGYHAAILFVEQMLYVLLFNLYRKRTIRI